MLPLPNALELFWMYDDKDLLYSASYPTSACAQNTALKYQYDNCGSGLFVTRSMCFVFTRRVKRHFMTNRKPTF